MRFYNTERRHEYLKQEKQIVMTGLFYIVSGSLLLIVIGAGIYALRNLYIEEKNILLDKEKPAETEGSPSASKSM